MFMFFLLSDLFPTAPKVVDSKCYTNTNYLKLVEIFKKIP